MSENKDINLQMLHLYLHKSCFDKDIYIDTLSLSYFYNYAGMNYLNDKDVDLPIKGLFKWLHLYIHEDEEKIGLIQHCISVKFIFIPVRMRRELEAVLSFHLWPLVIQGKMLNLTQYPSLKRSCTETEKVTRQKTAKVLRHQKDTGTTKQFQTEGNFLATNYKIGILKAVLLAWCRKSDCKEQIQAHFPQYTMF